MHNNIDYLLVRQRKDGKPIKIQALARLLYPDASITSATQSFHNLRTGKQKRVTIEQIKILCTQLETTFEELFYE